MKVCFLYDPGNADGTLGGAELTMTEFRWDTPDSVQIVDCTNVADTVVVGNCVTFSDIRPDLQGKRVFRYHNDLARHESPELREWLELHATHIFTSPLHRMKYGRPDSLICPPAINLSAFRPNRQTRRNPKRKGAVSIGAWQNPGKGQHLLREWSERANTPLDVYGTGAHIPTGPTLEYMGPLDYSRVPQTLWSYETFVFLPTAIEPFGRTVVEAWAAGCEIVTNENVGAKHFIENDPEALDHAAEMFWGYICE